MTNPAPTEDQLRDAAKRHQRKADELQRQAAREQRLADKARKELKRRRRDAAAKESMSA